MTVGRLRREGDAQRPHRLVDLVAQGPRQRRCRERLAQLGARDRVEDGSAVADRAGDRVLDGHGTARVGVLGTERHPSPRGLQPEEPAARRRIADGAAEVVGVSRGHHPGRHRCGGPATGAGRRPLEVPRVAGGPEEAGLAVGRRAELGGVGLAEDDEPGSAQPHHELLVVRRHVVAQEAGALGERHAGGLGDEVLQQERHTGERAGVVDGHGARGVEGLVVRGRHHGVDGGVQRLDSLDGGLDQLDRLDVAPRHERRLVAGVEVGELRSPNHRHSLSAPATSGDGYVLLAHISVPRTRVGGLVRVGEGQEGQPAGSCSHSRPNQRCTRVAPNATLSAASAEEGPSRSPTGAAPLRKVTSTRATWSWPNSR